MNEEIPEFGIPRENEERRDGGCVVVFDPEANVYAVGQQTEDGLFRLFSGGFDAGEDPKTGCLRELREESGLHNFSQVEKIGEANSHYYNILRRVNRVAHVTCYLVILKSRAVESVRLEEHEKFTLAWATAAEIIDNWKTRNQNHDYDHWIYFLEKGQERLAELGYDS